MMKKIKIIIAILVLAFITIQFIRPKRNEGKVNPAQTLAGIYNPPDSVQRILQIACMDCHSDQTNYPWYFKTQPAAWIMAHHIREGKEELNLDEFGSYSGLRQRSKLQDMRDEIRDGVMPLKSYKLFHPEARLSGEQKKVMVHWLSHKVDSLNRVELQMP